jgi:hypothetical protein
MKTIRNFALPKFAVAALLAFGLNTGIASAQIQTGTFSLPFEAHWGLATLAAGDYSFTVEGIGREAKIHIFHGAETVAYMLNQGYENRQCEKVVLTVVRTSTGNFVRDLALPGLEQVLHFSAPKPERGAVEQVVARLPSAHGSR